MVRALVITSYNPSAHSPHERALKEFARAITRRGEIEVAYCSVRELIFVLADATLQILLKGQDIAKSFDVLMLRNMHKYTDYARSLQLYASHNGLRVINEQDLMHPVYGKVSQGFLFALNGIPTPDFVSSPSNAALTDYLQTATLSYPLIVKHNEGIKGLYNYLVKDKPTLREVLGNDKQGFVVQPYIENEGELRILTFGQHKEPLIFKKQAGTSSHLNNTSRGGKAILVEASDLDPEVLAVAKKAARATGRDIGGVDVLLGKDGSRYVLEVNHTAALASGAFLNEKQAALGAYLQEIGA